MSFIESCCKTPPKAVLCANETVFGCYWCCRGTKGTVPGLGTWVSFFLKYLQVLNRCFDSWWGARRYCPPHLFQKNFCPLGFSFWCSCLSYPCQKRSDWHIQQINLFVDCLQLCFISIRIRDLQIGRKTKSIPSFEHSRKTAPVLSTHV